jgi:hypothetical protein
MLRPARSSPSARLNCEALEDRLTPVAAYSLAGVGVGAANLLAFDTNTPSITTTTQITNIATNEQLVGIDFRPQNGQLYALGVDTVGSGPLTGKGTIYNISIRTGRATPIGGTGSVDPTSVVGGVALPNPTTAGVGFGFDFNPAVDKIRVVTTPPTGPGQSFVVDQNTGTVAVNAPPINGATTTVSGTSYTNTQPNATATTQYSIDAVTDSLYLQDAGLSTTSVPLLIRLNGVTPLDFSTVNGFDIPTGVTSAAPNGTPVVTGSAFASLTVGGVSRLYSIDLTNGNATLMGTIGSGAGVSGLAIQNDFAGTPTIALSGAETLSPSLVRFNTSTPGTQTSVPITVLVAGVPTAFGTATGETLVGIAYRPQTGQLFGLGVNATGTGTLYRIDPQTGSATPIGAPGSINPVTPAQGAPGTPLPNPATAGVGFGFAFNPAVDLIRVITTAGQSFVINQNTGVVLVNSPNINGATTSVDSVAYTNAFGQVAGGPTTLYVLDAASDALYIANPGTGTATRIAGVTTGGATLNFSSATGFEVPPGATTPTPNGSPVAAGVGYATLTVGATTSLYSINLLTGVATNLGTVPAGTSGLTLSDAPAGVISFQSGSFSVNEGGSASVVITRNSGSGPVTVNVNVSGGSATAGADFSGGPFSVVIPDGATSATLTIPITADQLTEGAQTLSLTLSAAGAAIGAVGSTTINIADTSLTPTPPVPPPPAFSGVTAIPGGVILTGAGVPGGSAFLALPPGSAVLFSDVNGDGKGDVIFLLPGLVAAVDGQTGQLFAIATDLNGDRITDFQVFNPDGTTTRVNGLNGMVF